MVKDNKRMYLRSGSSSIYSLTSLIPTALRDTTLRNGTFPNLIGIISP